MAGSDFTGHDLPPPYQHEHFDGDTIVVNTSRHGVDDSATAAASSDGHENVTSVATSDQRPLDTGAVTIDEARATLGDALATTTKSRQSQREPKHVACVPCRKRKIKCDGARPACGTCKKESSDCAYGAVRKGQHGSGQPGSSQQSLEPTPKQQAYKVKVIVAGYSPRTPRRSARISGQQTKQAAPELEITHDDRGTASAVVTDANSASNEHGRCVEEPLSTSPPNAPHDEALNSAERAAAPPPDDDDDPDQNDETSLEQDLYLFMAKRRGSLAASQLDKAIGKLHGIARDLHQLGAVTDLPRRVGDVVELLIDHGTGDFLSCEDGLLSDGEIRTWKRDFGVGSEGNHGLDDGEEDGQGTMEKDGQDAKEKDEQEDEEEYGEGAEKERRG